MRCHLATSTNKIRVVYVDPVAAWVFRGRGGAALENFSAPGRSALAATPSRPGRIGAGESLDPAILANGGFLRVSAGGLGLVGMPVSERGCQAIEVAPKTASPRQIAQVLRSRLVKGNAVQGGAIGGERGRGASPLSDPRVRTHARRAAATGRFENRPIGPASIGCDPKAREKSQSSVGKMGSGESHALARRILVAKIAKISREAAGRGVGAKARHFGSGVGRIRTLCLGVTGVN